MASKLHKNRGTCCTAALPFYLFPIRYGSGFGVAFHSALVAQWLVPQWLVPFSMTRVLFQYAVV